MIGFVSSVLPQSRRRPIATCFASLFALSAPAVAIATTWTVTSCDGDAVSGSVPGHTGTLRFCIANAASTGDTIDLSGQTACTGSKISLTTGALTISQNSLRLLGPGAAVLKIDASTLARTQYVDNRVITHYGSGTLTIEQLGATGGYVNHYSLGGYGGCIYSHGNVKLVHSAVSSCINYSTENVAKGGAVFAVGYASLSYSQVSGGYAHSPTGHTVGGGVYAFGNVVMQHSTISGNTAKSAFNAFGGGVYAKGNLSGQFSTLDGNSSYANGIGAAKGGGAYTYGNVNVGSLVVTNNSVVSLNDAGKGGGLYTKGNVTLQLSTLSGNSASGYILAGGAKGGGANTRGNFFAGYSTISNNKTYGFGFGAGLYLSGLLNTIATSTISGNVSYNGYAGVDVYSGAAVGSSFLISNSTISNNHATYNAGGLYVDSRTTKLYNSTIAFNTAKTYPGAVLSAKNAAMSATIQSTLISNNSYNNGFSDNDLYERNAGAITINGGNTSTPANNLVHITFVTNLPTDTKGNCPRIGQLRNNGGLTETHALMSHSAAIDSGNDIFGVFYDQRGPASVNGQRDYTRFSGIGAIADIGAYEVQQNDIVFNEDFDYCLPPAV